jgi:hypothetical protein
MSYQLLAPFIGSTLENFVRQPLTSVTTVMIQEKKSFLKVTADTYRLGGVKLFFNGAQGFLISWGTRALHRVSTFSMNDALKKQNTPLWVTAPVITLSEAVTTTFGELILTVAQKNRKVAPLTLLKERIQSKGLSSISTGAGGNIMRNLIFNTILFGFKNRFENELSESPLLGSACISAIAVISSHPAEVVRMYKVDNPSLSYQKHCLNILSHRVGEMFRGLCPRMASTGVGMCITLSIVTYLQPPKKT